MDPTEKAAAMTSITTFALYRSRFKAAFGKDVHKLETLNWDQIVSMIQKWRRAAEDDADDPYEDDEFGDMVISGNTKQLAPKTIKAMKQYFGQLSLRPGERDNNAWSHSKTVFDGLHGMEVYFKVYGAGTEPVVAMYQMLCGVLQDAAQNGEDEEDDVFSYSESTYTFATPVSTGATATTKSPTSPVEVDFI